MRSGIRTATCGVSENKDRDMSAEVAAALQQHF